MLRIRLLAAGIAALGGALILAMVLVADWRYPYGMAGGLIPIGLGAVGFWLGEEAVATHRTWRFVLRATVLMIVAVTVLGGIALELILALSPETQGMGTIGAGLQWASLLSFFYLPTSVLFAAPIAIAMTFGTRRFLRRYWSALSR
jgi:hypothetical protein